MAENKENDKKHNVIFLLAKTDNEDEYQYYYKDLDALYAAFDSICKLIDAENAKNKADTDENQE